MSTGFEFNKHRREFLKTGLRNIFLGVFLFVGGLFGRRQLGIRNGGDSGYVNQPPGFPCGGCPEVQDCNDPRALTQKNIGKTVSNPCCVLERGESNVKQNQ